MACQQVLRIFLKRFPITDDTDQRGADAPHLIDKGNRLFRQIWIDASQLTKGVFDVLHDISKPCTACAIVHPTTCLVLVEDSQKLTNSRQYRFPILRNDLHKNLRDAQRNFPDPLTLFRGTISLRLLPL